MNIVIDMNLSPLWVDELGRAGYYATHWSTIGSPDASDMEIMEWARAYGSIVFTHDLDFGAILASTSLGSPSVLQLRTPDPVPQSCGSLVVAALKQCAEELGSGALVTINVEKHGFEFFQWRSRNSGLSVHLRFADCNVAHSTSSIHPCRCFIRDRHRTCQAVSALRRGKRRVVGGWARRLIS